MPGNVASAEAELAARVRSLVSIRCGIGVVRVGDRYDPLPEIEARAVAQAVAKRKHQFAAGRIAARAALVQLGNAACEIPRSPNGQPCWPQGVVGSISHTNDMAVAVVAPKSTTVSVGIDIEAGQAVTEELWGQILDDDEIALVRARPDPLRAATTLFALKEAFYKFQHPLTDAWLEFKGVAVTLGEEGMAAVALKRSDFPPLPPSIARVGFAAGLVVAVVHERPRAS